MRQAQREIIEVYTRPELHAATIWLHGLGVGGSDLDGIITSLKRCRDIGLHYQAPSAPIRSITVNQGLPCRAWFDVKGDPELAGVDEQGLAESVALVHSMLDEEVARGIDPQFILLGGFSQGGTVALHAGLTYSKPLAGIVGLSTEVLLADQLQAKAHAANRQTPVLLVHGEDDEVIPADLANDGVKALQGMGNPVDFHRLPMGHAVTAEAVSIVDDWAYPLLAKSLSPACADQ